MKYFKIKVKYLILLLIALSFLYASVPFAYSKIAKGYERKGKIEHAAVYYEKSLSLVPDF